MAEHGEVLERRTVMATKLARSSEVLSPGLLSGIPDSTVH